MYNNLRFPKFKENAELSRPMITFSFDDGYDSDYNIVFPVFKEYGIRGTFFVIGNEDRMGNPGIASAAQLKEMAQAGQEIACHGHGHLSYANEQDNEVIYNDMVLSKKTIEN